MTLYGGIDLHSNNSVVALSDQADRLVYRKGLPNDVQNLFSRNRGRSISANAARRLTPESVAELVADPNLALAIQSTVLAMHGQQAVVDLLEREAWR